MERNTSSSHSPSRRISFGTSLQALGAKISRTISTERGHDDKDTDSRSINTVGSKAIGPDMSSSDADRSLSRGREVYQSSGRGGAGNIRQASVSREARPVDGPDDFSIVRGREPVSAALSTFSTGRGGAGNIRSPSHGPKFGAGADDNQSLTDSEVIRAHVAASAEVPRSSGRGGAGNISSSRSRSRGPAALASPSTSTPPHTPAGVRSTGRGGAGNISVGADIDIHDIQEHDEDEEKRKTLYRNDGIHSTGRGGSANLTVSPAPGVERTTSRGREYESTGRGGSGNFVRDY
ncbi:hypothetical protein C0991_006625 [Blastosporella zonata]|nr:hypothetical protein C0991_006625 [Blastosporella zonata]